mmetsp:Transcript_94493/g.115742  ORF Transcript_94493/g.115742 Transcript_94493/m.115742 type:complete len:421 (+) Transcript_94493:49-1311(+)
MSLLVFFSLIVIGVISLDNGLARTPPMGWLSWQRFRCETDCNTYPNDCINANLYEAQADRLASDGWKDVGYVQVNIDDCWSTKERDPKTNEQVPDPDRFPNGIKAVADYVHSKGLKLGLYSDIGTHTCGGYTGMEGYFELDANTFASWDIDMLKVDGCYANTSSMYIDYPNLGKALNATGHPIIYSCSWPAYISGHGEDNPPVKNTTMADIAEYCNLWRNYDDVQDSWASVTGIINYWKRDYNKYYSTPFLNVSGPGQWNDPDMVIGGANGLSVSEALTQFTVYAIVSAPLLLGNDLRKIAPEIKTILQNKEIIDVNQDPMGKQGGYIYSDNSATIWMKELTGTNTPIAIVFQSTATGGFGSYFTFNVDMIPKFVTDWNGKTSFKVRNIVNGTDLGTYSRTFKDLVEPSSANMYKIEIVS